MQTDKQKWVEDALKSIDGGARAQAPDMTDAVLSRIGRAGNHTIAPVADSSFLWKIAASVAFVLLLNAVTIYSYQSHMPRGEKNRNIQAAASELGLGQSNNDPGAVIFGN